MEESREKKRRERGEKEQDIMEKEIASRHLFCHSRYTHIPAFGVLGSRYPHTFLVSGIHMGPVDMIRDIHSLKQAELGVHKEKRK